MKHNFDYKVPNQIGSFGQLGVLKKNAFGCSSSESKGYHLVCHQERYEGVKEGPKPNDIIQLMRTEHGCKISYDLAWEAREYAVNCVRGIPEESYGKIPMYLHMAKEANPGTHTAYKTDPDGSFRYMFIAYGQSIRGFHKVMRQLHVVIEDDYTLAFISDRNPSIARAIRIVYQRASHGICIHHLLNNVISHLPWKRYDIRTTNPAESLNNALRSPREFPVIPLLDSIREMLTRWFYERRTLSSKHNHPLTEAAEMKITEELKRGMRKLLTQWVFLRMHGVFQKDLEDELVTCPESRRAAGRRRKRRFETVEDKIRSHKKLKRYTSAVDVISPATTEQPVICLYSGSREYGEHGAKDMRRFVGVLFNVRIWSLFVSTMDKVFCMSGIWSFI
ncbi:unnamed protein product [Microthlaspi erraticum]|uniref:MULE transposase domain-containing protein n=1 Tax=Microthlaspi erraticum TaxID=1685480 RepID=A0A6D2L992_9BRAS|nr:unnamed protein product [Microthlaspi erraticum]